ncbi:MAG: hypothetical protein EBS97_05445 [Verrucomicrobia bacterium]|nr:hypothetical protein [Verrucomicrobiota bacterium]
MPNMDKHQIVEIKKTALIGLRRRISTLYALSIFGVWASLYLPNLADTPRWYGDETVTLGCGQDLAKGLFANRAIWNTYINPQFCYQPGYVFVVGMLSNLGHGNIAWPRLLNATAALGVAWICLFWLGRRISLTRALMASMLFLTYEQTIIHFRWVYAHNAAALGIFFSAVLLSQRKCARRDWQSGLGLALAAASHPLAIHGGIAACLNRWSRPKSWPRILIPPLVMGILCILPIWIWNFPWWWSDLHDLREFYAGFSRELAAGIQWPINFWMFFIHDWFHVLSACSLLFCLFTPLRPVALTAIVLVGLLTQNRQNLPVFYYQAVVALPLLAACLGLTLSKLPRKFFRKIPWVRWIPFLLPTALWIHEAPKVWGSELISRNDPWVVQSIHNHLDVIDWLNRNTQPEDLVICHWNIGWRLNCQNADPMMSVAWEGLPTFTYEHGLAKNRFRYSADIRSAKFLVLTDIDRIWTLGQPNVQAVINDRTLSGWQPVFQSGTCLVLAPPGPGPDAKQ